MKNAKDLLFQFDPQFCKRKVGGKDFVVNSTLFHAKFLSSIRSAEGIHGDDLIRTIAETSFAGFFQTYFFRKDHSADEKWKVVQQLYRDFGYGLLDLSRLNEGIIMATASWFSLATYVFGNPQKENVCCFTEGFLQGAYYAITGEPVWVEEVHCKAWDWPHCSFFIKHDRTQPIAFYPWQNPVEEKRKFIDPLCDPKIDEGPILEAVERALGGSLEITPALLFGVPMAGLPADFCALLAMRFVEAMHAAGKAIEARQVLLSTSEVSTLLMFQHVMRSSEWKTIVRPLIRSQRDLLEAVLAVMKGMGWGNLYLRECMEDFFFIVASTNNYEALFYKEMRGRALVPQCPVLTGISVGLIELVYSEGPIEEKVGDYHVQEKTCVSCDNFSCKVVIEKRH